MKGNSNTSSGGGMTSFSPGENDVPKRNPNTQRLVKPDPLQKDRTDLALYLTKIQTYIKKISPENQDNSLTDDPYYTSIQVHENAIALQKLLYNRISSNYTTEMERYKKIRENSSSEGSKIVPRVLHRQGATETSFRPFSSESSESIADAAESGQSGDIGVQYIGRITSALGKRTHSLYQGR